MAGAYTGTDASGCQDFRNPPRAEAFSAIEPQNAVQRLVTGVRGPWQTPVLFPSPGAQRVAAQRIGELFGRVSEPGIPEEPPSGVADRGISSREPALSAQPGRQNPWFDQRPVFGHHPRQDGLDPGELSQTWPRDRIMPHSAATASSASATRRRAVPICLSMAARARTARRAKRRTSRFITSNLGTVFGRNSGSYSRHFN
jgi:hypothetical protein